MDGTIPRGKRLPRCCAASASSVEAPWLACRQRLPCRRRQPASADPVRRQQARRIDRGCEKCGADILRLCVEVGGVLTGEHGVGIEKRDLMGEMFTRSTSTSRCAEMRVRSRRHLLNPGKVFPKLCRCAELGRVHRDAQAASSRSPTFRGSEAMTGLTHADATPRTLRDGRAPGPPLRASAARRCVGTRAPSARSAGRCTATRACSTCRGISGCDRLTNPNELVITCSAGTPMRELSCCCSRPAGNQMLAFEPPRPRPF